MPEQTTRIDLARDLYRVRERASVPKLRIERPRVCKKRYNT